jgi:hypothetical protein
VAFAHLAVALADGYPSIRTIARRSLKALDRELGLGCGRLYVRHVRGCGLRRGVLKLGSAPPPGASLRRARIPCSTPASGSSSSVSRACSSGSPTT